MKKINLKKGFTLIELLIYISGMVVLVAVLALLIVQIYGLYDRLTIASRTDAAVISALDKIIREVRNSDSVDYAESSLADINGVLSLNTIDSSGQATTVKINLATSSIYMTEGGSSAIKMLPSNVQISSLIFNEISTSISKAIRISITLNYNIDSATTTKTYNSVAILRGSY